MTFEDIAREFLESVTGEFDNYSSEKGIIENNGDGSMTLLTPSHVQFARYGRGKGKMPPLGTILEFVEREGIIFSGLDEKGTAQAMQAAIGARGTLNHVENAPDFVDEVISKHQKEYFDSIGTFISTEIEGKYLQGMDDFETSFEKNFKNFKA